MPAFELKQVRTSKLALIVDHVPSQFWKADERPPEINTWPNWHAYISVAGVSPKGRVQWTKTLELRSFEPIPEGDVFERVSAMNCSLFSPTVVSWVAAALLADCLHPESSRPLTQAGVPNVLPCFGNRVSRLVWGAGTRSSKPRWNLSCFHQRPSDGIPPGSQIIVPLNR